MTTSSAIHDTFVIERAYPATPSRVFAKSGDGTALSWTEQGAYLDGIDGAEAPALRMGGTAEMLDGLAGYLRRQVAADGES